MKKKTFPFGIWLVFETVAVILWLALDNIFYFYNFSYIGTCLFFGIAFYLKKKKYARSIVQFELLPVK